jgi:hypothetical protein
MRLIEKEMTDRFYDILEKHGNKTWVIDELEWLIDINCFNFTNDEEFTRTYKIIRILRNY